MRMLHEVRLLCLFFLLTSPCLAQMDICLVWAETSDPTIAGYKVYVDTQSMLHKFPGDSNFYRIIDAGHDNFVCVMDLTPDTTYFFAVTSYNATKEEGDWSNEVFETFTTIDWTPPIFTNITAQIIVDTKVKLIWTTNELADTQVEYGPTTTYENSTVWDETFTLSHAEVIEGLSPGDTYHFRLRSMDQNYNQGVSADITITMPMFNQLLPPTGGRVEVVRTYENRFNPDPIMHAFSQHFGYRSESHLGPHAFKSGLDCRASL